MMMRLLDASSAVIMSRGQEKTASILDPEKRMDGQVTVVRVQSVFKARLSSLKLCGVSCRSKQGQAATASCDPSGRPHSRLLGADRLPIHQNPKGQVLWPHMYEAPYC